MIDDVPKCVQVIIQDFLLESWTDRVKWISVCRSMKRSATSYEFARQCYRHEQNWSTTELADNERLSDCRCMWCSFFANPGHIPISLLKEYASQIPDGFCWVVAAFMKDLSWVQTLPTQYRTRHMTKNGVALRLACINGYNEMVKMFMTGRESKFDITLSLLVDLLYDACYYGHLYIVDLILKDRRLNRVKPEYLCNILSTCRNQLHIAKRLLDDGRFHAKDAISKACYYQNIDFVCLLLQTDQQLNNQTVRDALYSASWSGNLEIIKMLLHHNSSTEVLLSALSSSISWRNIHVIEYVLLQYTIDSIDIHIKREIIDTATRNNREDIITIVERIPVEGISPLQPQPQPLHNTNIYHQDFQHNKWTFGVLLGINLGMAGYFLWNLASSS
eukprot:GILJ01017475.1.p1 GENE.GILJ01017475.1~~GILJ01017475.1.p1  ORF type:complete len:389 (+),score=21.84 GILJ01017475.1:157-1323(+)